MQRYNKGTAAVLGGAIVTVIGAFWNPGPEVLGALQTIVVAGLVVLVPNRN